MDNWSGRTLKGYQLIERIGAGGFGAVYRARQSTIDREVAVKIILPGFANQPDFIRRFETEAQVIARLEHPYITPLYDYWRDPQGAYLVMRWLRGGSLHTALKDGPFDLAAAALLIDQVCSALALAHRCGIIHRDLKPGNILLDEDGNAYLADFGIAKVLRDISAGLTKPDDIVGSLDYISPEQARGEPVTPCTDIYSLGVVLYEVLTGEHPFPNCSAVERLYKHINDPLPVIEKLDPVVRDEINAIIQRATAKDPAHRYPDVLALAVAFREGVRPVVTPSEQNIVEQLTYREQEILQCIADGLSNKEIANNLFISEPTVKWHIRQVYRKLGVRSRVQAVIRARELDLIVSGERDESGRVSGATTSSTGLPEPENPYKGLLAFQPADHLDFFGREELIDKLVGRMAENHALGRFLAVIGPSGSGKSSLVKAGLIPALWAGKLPGSEKWFVVDMLPGAHPLDELEVALTRLAANQAGNLREQLARDERGLLRAAGLILPGDGSELVLIVDQFEELFTLVNEDDERIQFMNLLRTAVTETRSRVRVVITLRADFYDRPLRYPEFGELVRQRMETLLPLTAKGLERAIAGPAQRVGIRLEEGLVATIVGEMNYQAGALPLLQYALTELFERRDGRRLTNQAYHEIGGAVGALAKRADEVYLSLDAVGQELTRQMFLRLVTLGEGTTDTRRRTPRSELLAIAPEAGHDGHGSTDLIGEIIDTYAAYRLLLLDHDPATRSPTVEVAHEAILLEWERLREWLNDCREEIRWQRQLAQMAREWHAGGRDVSFLLRGARLEQFVGWAAETQMALTQRERPFLETSIHEQQRREQDEQLRQQQELETQRQLAEQRQRAATNLRNLVIALSVFLVAALGLSLVAVDREQKAQTARTAAEREAAVNHSLVLAGDAKDMLEGGNTDLALALAMEAIRIDDFPPEAENALRLVALSPGLRAQLRIGGGNTVKTVDISRDNRWALSGSCAELQDDDTCIQGELIIWDLTTNSEKMRLEGLHDWVTSAEFSIDSQSLVSSSADGRIILWDVAAGEIIREFTRQPASVNEVTFSPDGKTILSAGTDSAVILWNTATGDEIRRFRGHETAVSAIDFSGDGTIIASGSDDGSIIIWDVATSDQINIIDALDKVFSLRFHPTQPEILFGFADALRKWDIRSGENLNLFQSPGLATAQIDISSDGETIAATEHSVGLINTTNLQEFESLSGHVGVVRDVAISTDGRLLIAGAEDGTVDLWNLSVTSEIKTISMPFPVFWLDRASDSTDLYVGSVGVGKAMLWNPQNGDFRVIREIPGFQASGHFSPDGERLLLAFVRWIGTKDEHILSMVDVVTGHELFAITDVPEYNAHAPAIDFSPDDNLLAIGSVQFVTGTTGDGELILYDANTGEKLLVLSDTEDFSGADFSYDGRSLLTCSVYNGNVSIWDVDTGVIIWRFEYPTSFWQATFSADEKSVYVGTLQNHEIWQIDIETKQIVRRFVGHTNAPWRITFNWDKQLMLSSQITGPQMILWDLTTGHELTRFSGNTDLIVLDMLIGPDGQTAFSASRALNDRGVLREWLLRPMTLEELLAWTRANRYVRDLTCEERAQYRIEPLCEAES